MSILHLRATNFKKSGNLERAKRIVTYWLTPTFHNYLVLYTHALGISKTSVLRKVATKFLKKRRIKYPEEVLLEMIKERALNAWKVKKAKKPDILLHVFRKQLIYELEWKGLTVDQIKIILTGFNNGTR